MWSTKLINNEYCVIDPDGIPIAEISLYFKQVCKSLSMNTKYNHAEALMLWFDFLSFKGVHFSDVKSSHIIDFYSWISAPKSERYSTKLYLHKESAIKSSTWNQYYSRIQRFYEQWVIPRYSHCKIFFRTQDKVNIKNRRSKTSIFTHKAWNLDPKTKYIKLADFDKILSYANKRDQLIFTFMLYSGIRRGELFNISIREFKELKEKENIAFLRLRESNKKHRLKQTKTGGRYILIPSNIAHRLKSYILWERQENKSKHEEIFTVEKNTNKSKIGDPLSPSTISNSFASCCRKASLKYTLHDLRHTCITMMLELDMDIKNAQEIIGHKSITTTSIYDNRDLLESAKKLAKLYHKGSESE